MPRHRPRSVVVVLVAALALVAGALPAFAQPATPAGGPRVVEQRPVKLAEGRKVLALSPDGRRLLARSGAGDEFCFHEVATLTVERCAAWPSETYDRSSFVWSPDGGRVAFSAAVPERATPGAIWLLDAETGALSDLSGDGPGGSLLGNKERPPTDSVPTWSPDGREVAFARTTADGTVLLRVAVAADAPRRLEPLHAIEADVSLTGMVWQRTPDGEVIVYSALDVGPGTREAAMHGGVWAIGPGGGVPRRLAAAAGDERGVPQVLAVSARGDVLLLDQRAIALIVPPFLSLLPAGGGPEAPLTVPGAGSADAPEALTAAAFSPDGALLLGISYGPDYSKRLVLRDLASGRETILFDDFAPSGIPPEQFVWATDGTVYAPGTSADGADGLLLRLEEAGGVPPGVVPSGSPAAAEAAAGIAATLRGLAARVGGGDGSARPRLVRGDGFEGVIVPEELADDFHRGFFGLPAAGYWTPTEADVVALEAGLPGVVRDAGGSGVAAGGRVETDLWRRLPDYRRQYVGLVEGGGRRIFVNLFCDAEDHDWRNEPVAVDDGGDCYLQAIYDLGAGEFLGLRVNGLG